MDYYSVTTLTTGIFKALKYLVIKMTTNLSLLFIVIKFVGNFPVALVREVSL